MDHVLVSTWDSFIILQENEISNYSELHIVFTGSLEDCKKEKQKQLDELYSDYDEL